MHVTFLPRDQYATELACTITDLAMPETRESVLKAENVCG